MKNKNNARKIRIKGLPPRSIFNVSTTGEILVSENKTSQYGIDMIIHMQLKREFDLDTVWRAYESLIRDHQVFRSLWCEEEDGTGFTWYAFTPEETEEYLAMQREFLSKYWNKEEILATDNMYAHIPIPFRICMSSPTSIIFFMNHIYMNALAGSSWSDIFFSYYEKIEGRGTEDDINKRFKVHTQKMPSWLWLLNIIQFPYRLAQTYLWLKKFIYESGPNDCESPSYYRKYPDISNKRHFYKQHVFDSERTKKILADSKNTGMTITQYLMKYTADAFFEHEKKKNRLFIYLPVDCHYRVPDVSILSPGNYVGSAWVQLFRGRPIKEQLQRQWKWFKKDIPYWLYVLMNITMRNKRKYRAEMIESKRRAVFDGGNIANASLVFSSIGVSSRFPVVERNAETVGFFSRIMNLPILTFGTLNGRLTCCIGAPESHCNVKVLERIIDRVVQDLYARADEILQ